MFELPVWLSYTTFSFLCQEFSIGARQVALAEAGALLSLRERWSQQQRPANDDDDESSEEIVPFVGLVGAVDGGDYFANRDFIKV